MQLWATECNRGSGPPRTKEASSVLLVSQLHYYLPLKALIASTQWYFPVFICSIYTEDLGIYIVIHFFSSLIQSDLNSKEHWSYCLLTLVDIATPLPFQMATAVKKRYREFPEEKARLKVRRSTSVAMIALAFKLSIPNEEGFC